MNSIINNYTSELGLFVIWPRYVHLQEQIIDSIQNRFKIRMIQKMKWSKDKHQLNYYRFYGDKLSTSSIKEKQGNGETFIVIVFEDEMPTSQIVLTSRGIEKVNINFFLQKSSLRKQFKTKFGFHASNSLDETRRDLMLLLGITLQDVPNNLVISNTTMQRDITGSNNWESFDQLFRFLNEVDPYVVLRNESMIFEEKFGEDIDFLCYNSKKFALFLNAKKQSRGYERANHEITVGSVKIPVDLRYVGDGYFDCKWQENCLKNRIKSERNVYILDNQNLYYSLAYHSFIHKKSFPDKYSAFFEVTQEELRYKLYEFMDYNNYQMVEPKDITLFFNVNNGGTIKFTKYRRRRYKRGLKASFKRFFYNLSKLLLIKSPY
jgi:hypothetical protein